ncbi:MAG: PH domain-containing protein [Gammaproteobacteria bacterium]|nr:PH domain-containing protein [Gammaproteobacteria bacterium]
MILLLVTSSTYNAMATAGLVLAVAMPVWLLAGTTYCIRNGTLTVSKLFRRKHIDLAVITAVKPWPRWSHPIEYGEDFALSSKRLLITHAESRIFVSPRDEENFLAALGRPFDTK